MILCYRIVTCDVIELISFNLDEIKVPIVCQVHPLRDNQAKQLMSSSAC